MNDLRRRLKRLGAIRGRASKKPLGAAASIETLVAGEIIEREECLITREVYPGAVDHGAARFEEWLYQQPETIAAVGAVTDLQAVAPHDFLFLDTETTGLGGGAMAFEVGIGFFNTEGDFEIQQFFLRDPAEEAAMLDALQEHITPDTALVTFNGRTFDVPLLAGRFVMNRMPAVLQAVPNFDLLMPARRLWRRRLTSCALSALEKDVLGVYRSQEDVSGSLIPWLYQQYLRTGDARPMVKVLYHNKVDLLSMVTLAAVLCRTFEGAFSEDFPAADRISLAQWYQRLDQPEKAESAYRDALHHAENEADQVDGLYGLAMLLKRSERRDEAVTYWKALAELGVDTTAHVELAKHYEWHAADLSAALEWTEQALHLVQSPSVRSELEHRRRRLRKKLDRDDA